MKKLLKSLMLLLTTTMLFPLSGCSGSDKNLEPNIIKDQYRTYYEIFVGAFSDGDGDGMGDFKGLINRLDYLNDGDPKKGNDLGIDGIWLMPIMDAGSYHKYDVKDYCSIDKDYGTMEDFDAFLDEANKRGINVIIDLVINHTSHLHPWFLRAKKAVQEGDFDNPYIDYYSIVPKNEMEQGHTYYQIGNTGYYYEGNFSDQMPELNMDNEEVKNEIVKIIKFWLEKGVGGFRIDAAKYVYLDDTSKNVVFWKWFDEEVRKVKEDAYIVGEVWSGDVIIEKYYEAINCFDFGMSQVDGLIAGTANQYYDVNYFVDQLDYYKKRMESYNENAILNPFISNHDMDRSAGYLIDGAQKVAANLYLLSSGNPFIYYGEEIGMKGSRGTANTDANRRLAMLWGDKDTVQDPVGTTFEKDRQTNGTVKEHLKNKNSLFKHYQKLIKIRNANPEIARGDYTKLTFDGYYSFGGFLTTYENSTLGIFHNTFNGEIKIDLSKYTDYTFESIRSYVGEGKAKLDGMTLTLDGYTSVILK